VKYIIQNLLQNSGIERFSLYTTRTALVTDKMQYALYLLHDWFPACSGIAGSIFQTQ
jgi:hypothetical protein